MRKQLTTVLTILILANAAAVAFGQNQGKQPITVSERLAKGAQAAALTGAIAPALAIPVGIGAAATGDISSGIGFVSWISTKAVGAVFLVINFIIGLVGAAFFNLGALLIQLGIVLNTSILDSVIVKLGWQIVRDITNLGFVVGILVIAFATMLRIESYAMKKTLVQLIVAALLVNFSLAIAGVFIDISNLFTNFFIRKSISTPHLISQDAVSYMTGMGEFVGNLAAAFGPQALFETNQDLSAFEYLADTGGNLIVMILNSIFVALFTLFAAEGMIALAFMTFYRYVMLSILLILLPGALLLWVFPDLKHYWKEWVSHFIKEVIYLPVSTFFIYLAIVLVQSRALVTDTSFNNLISLTAESVGGQAFERFLRVMAKPFSSIGQMAVVLGLLLGGIFAAKKIGATGASSAIAGATWARNLGLGLVGKGVNRFLTTETVGQFIKERPKLEKFLETTQGIAGRAPKAITALRQAILAGGGIEAPKKKKEGGKEGEVEKKPSTRTELARQYSAMTTGERIQTARDKKVASDPLKAATLASVMAQKGELDNLTAEELAPLKQAAINTGDRESLKYRPDWAADYGTTVKDTMDGMSGGERAKISHRALENVEVVNNLNDDDLDRFARGTPKQKETMVNTILANIDNTAYQDKLIDLGNGIARGGPLWSGTKGREVAQRIQEIRAARVAAQQAAQQAAAVAAAPAAPLQPPVAAVAPTTQPPPTTPLTPASATPTTTAPAEGEGGPPLAKAT